MELKVKKAEILKKLPEDENKLGFGKYFTDHMFIMKYSVENGWHDGKIIPYGPIELDPSAMVLHYGQEVFEGLKAYRRPDGKIQLFRPQENFKRLNSSNDRLCIPRVDEEYSLKALKKLIEIDERWVPYNEGCSLYIRPFIIAVDAHVGVRAGKEYLYVIILSPVGAYYPEGLNPTKIYVEEIFARAVKGGTGMAKTGGNYASSLKAQDEANEQGYTQVLWLDGAEKKYIEEVGTMNVFFVLGDEIVTPSIDGSILPGITRKSSIQMLRHWGYNVVERKLPLEEVVSAYDKGILKEAFGTGTAAVISPIGLLKVGEKEMIIGDGLIGEISKRLYDNLTGIQWGRKQDIFCWTELV